MQEKIRLVNSKGETFFECSPAEARAAIKAIEEEREDHDGKMVDKRLKAILDHDFNALKAIHVSNVGAYASDGLRANMIADMFRVVENSDVRVQYVWMKAVRYADLRRFDRSELDIEIQARKLRTGLMAYMWGAMLIVTKDMPEDEVLMASDFQSGNPDVAIRWKFSFTGSPEPEQTRTERALEAIEKRLAAIEKRLAKKQPA